MPKDKIKVLILGKSGMLGHMVFRRLKSNRRLAVFGTQMTAHSKTDYFNILDGYKTLEKIFKRHDGFDYCINCIGITANKINTDNPLAVKRAYLINAAFPRRLAKIALKSGTKVIHISSDGVFSGKSRIYDEASPPDCKDVYGKTKLAGEIDAENVLNIRCSIIGPSPYEHSGLWEWFTNLPPGSMVKGFSDQIWNGITTLQFSLLCESIIIKESFSSLRAKSRIYHFAPNRPLSKFELLKVLKSCLKKEVSIEKTISENGKISRILHSRFSGLHKALPYGVTMRTAINQLLKYERKGNA